MLFAFKEVVKKASVAAVKAATTGTETTTKMMKTAMTAATGTHSVTKATKTTKTAMKAATAGKEAAMRAMKTTITAATSETNSVTKATKTTKTAIKAATAGKEAAMRAMKTTMTAATSGTEAAMKATKTTMKAVKAETNIVTKKTSKSAIKATATGTEAAKRTMKTAMTTATSGTKSAIQAMKASQTERNAFMKFYTKKTESDEKVVVEHETESEWKKEETKQVSELNETLDFLQKRINALQNDVLTIRKTLASAESKEQIGIQNIAIENRGTTEAEEDFCKLSMSPNITLKESPEIREEHDMQLVMAQESTGCIVGDADLQKGEETTGNKYVEILLIDNKGLVRIPIDESTNISHVSLIQRMFSLLMRLLEYIDVRAFINFTFSHKNKHIQMVSKNIVKVSLDVLVPGSKVVLNLADGCYHVYKGKLATGVMYLVFAGLDANAFDYNLDTQPIISTVEVGPTQSVSFAIVDVGTPITALDIEEPISTAIVDVGTPITTLDIEKPISTVNGKTEYAISVAVTLKEDKKVQN